MAQGEGLRNYFVNNEPRLPFAKHRPKAVSHGVCCRSHLETLHYQEGGGGDGRGFCLQAAHQLAATSRSFIPLYVSTESKLVRVAGELWDLSQCSS